MKIMQAEYTGNDIEKQQNWMARIKTTFTELLAGPSPIKKYLFS